MVRFRVTQQTGADSRGGLAIDDATEAAFIRCVFSRVC